MLHITIPEYDALIRCGAFQVLSRRVELIRGELTEMTPAGPLHDDIITYLTNWSLQHIDPKITFVTSQTGLDLSEQSSRPEPDLLWIRAGRYREHHPRAEDVQLVIEVANSSTHSDKEDKCQLYAEAGIREYWLVDLTTQQVHVFREPVNGSYSNHSIHSSDDEVSPSSFPQAKLNLYKLFQE